MVTRSLRLLAIAACAALWLPALAHATLVYQVGFGRPSLWIANDDGSGARRLTTGSMPKISPDGQWVAFVSALASSRPSLKVIPAAGGPVRTLLRPWRFGALAWSPDSRHLVAQTGREVGRGRLVLIDATAGTVTTVATGFFAGASFSPAGDQLVFSEFPSDRALFPKANLEVVPVAGGPPHAITTDGHSLWPVWGPTQIAYVRWQRPTGRHKRLEGPKYNLWLLAPDGSGRRQLTHDRVPFLLTGLVPTEWSADGSRLLAQFGGEDTSYAVTVDPASGRERVVGKKLQSIFATRISRDGSAVLGQTGAAAEDPKAENVIAAPYLGGPLTVLKKGANSPDWNR